MKSFKFDFIVVILTMLMSGYLMYSRVVFFRNKIKQQEIYTREIASVSRDAAIKNLAPGEQKDRQPAIPAVSPSENVSKEFRNLLFKYRSPTAKKVSIIGDFNDWTPQPMTRDKKGIWTIVLQIPPGYYAYNFIVDGRPQRDVNNPKTFDTGRGFISSYLEVKPLTEADKNR